MSGPSKAESSLPNKSTEQVLQNRFCLYLSGATGGKRTSIPIGSAFEQIFGKGNVLSEPSYASIDWPEKKPYDVLTKQLIHEISQGKKITLVAFSGGVIELVDVVKSLVKNNGDEKFWADNLEVILMAPPGIYRGIKQLVNSFRLFGRFAKGFLFGDFTGGLNSIYLNPPDPEIISNENLIKKTRALLPELSNIVDGPKVISLPRKTISIDEERKKQLLWIDQQLAFTKNRQEFTKLLKKRAKLFSSDLQQRYDVFLPKNQPLLDAAKIVSQEILGFARMFGYMTTGQIVKAIDKLHQMRVDLSLIVPEYDFIFPIKNFEDQASILKLTGKKPEEAILAFLALSAHHSWVMNPETLARAVAEKYK